MGFGAPLFIAATLLIAVPIAVHLVGRSRARPRPFAAFELLRRSERKIAQRTTVERWLLLAARALAIVAVPLILSKPYWETQSDLPAQIGASQSAVLIVDDGLGMGRRVGANTLFTEARRRARALIEGMGADSEIAVMGSARGDAAPLPQLAGERALALSTLDKLTPTTRPSDVAGALKRAQQVLQTAARPARHIYLLSDLAARSLDDAGAPPAGIQLVPVDVAEPPGRARVNRAVVDLAVEPAPEHGPRALRVTVDVASYGAAAHELPVTLRVDGRPVAKGFLDVAADARAQKRFVHTLPAEARERGETAHEIEVLLPPDDLPADDVRAATWLARRPLRVLIADGNPRTVRRDDEVFFLETALAAAAATDGSLRAEVVSAEELAARDLAAADVVFLCNLRTPPDAAKLRRFLERGGGLFIASGDNVNPDAYNAALGDLLPQPLASMRVAAAPAKSADSGGGDAEHIGAVDKSHPIIAPLAKLRLGDEARIYRYMLVRPAVAPLGAAATERARVLVHLEGGAPLLLEKSVGRGHVLLLATSVNRDWADLAIQPIFVPLMREAARYLGGGDAGGAPRPFVAGERAEAPLGDGSAELAQVTSPSGRVTSYARDRVAGRKTLPLGPVDEPGFYRLAVAPSASAAPQPRPDATFAVVLDPRGSDPRRIDAATLTRLTQSTASAPERKAPTRRLELWHLLGAILLGLLLVESILLARRR